MLPARRDPAEPTVLLVAWLVVSAVVALAMLATAAADVPPIAVLTLPADADNCADGAVYGDTGAGCD